MKQIIKDFMTSCPHTVEPSANLDVARQLMSRYGFHHLPVQKDKKLIGVISDRDVKYALGWAKSHQKELTIKDVYTPDPYMVSINTPLVDVVRGMVERHLGCALVADKDDKLLGIFTTTDACRYLVKLLH